MNSIFFKQPDFSTFQKHWGWFLTLGIAMVVLGLAAISLAVFTTIVSVISLGILILIAGVFILFDTVNFWWGKWGGFLLHLVVGLLYFVVGFMLINNPISGSISLTLLIGWFYLIVGIFRLVYSIALRSPRWIWVLVTALIAIILGVLILSSWPNSSLYIIGLFVGIDLIFYGWAYVMLALAGKNAHA